MARLHPTLKQALPLLPSSVPVHLFTRHSVRELASNGFADYRLPLTAEGIAMAHSWGAELGRPISRFSSSPVGRCVDTAKAMRAGALEAGLLDEKIAIEQSMVLVEPGCYVEDLAQVGPHFLKMGALRFINQYLGEGMPGLLTPEAGRHKLLNFMQERDATPGSLAVHVSHDTILIAFVASLLGLDKISERDWPWMMEGLWLWFDERELHWIWRGEWQRRELQSLLQPGD